MKNVIFYLIFSFGVYYAQELDKSDTNPCADPIISFARKNGVKALPITDIPKYLKISKACQGHGKAMIPAMIARDWTKFYQMKKY